MKNTEKKIAEKNQRIMTQTWQRLENMNFYFDANKNVEYLFSVKQLTIKTDKSENSRLVQRLVQNLGFNF